MAQYAVLIFERVPPEDLPPEVMQGHMDMPDRIAEQGGRVVAGLALEPPATATAIRGGVLTDGPFIETKEVLGGVFVIEARDLDHALALARMTPIVDGGVEVRPLVDFQVVEARLSARRAGGRRRAPARVGLRARRDGARHARPRRRRGGGAGRVRPGAARPGRATACPTGPGAWLTTVARRLALNLLRRRRTLEAKLPLLVEPDGRRPTTTTGRRTRSPTTGCGSCSPAAIRRWRARRRSR